MEWEDYKKERIEELFYTPPNATIVKGVWCPKCGGNVYKDNTVVLTTYPPMYRYFCGQCRWEETTY